MIGNCVAKPFTRKTIITTTACYYYRNLTCYYCRQLSSTKNIRSVATFTTTTTTTKSSCNSRSLPELLLHNNNNESYNILQKKKSIIVLPQKMITTGTDTINQQQQQQQQQQQKKKWNVIRCEQLLDQYPIGYFTNNNNNNNSISSSSSSRSSEVFTSWWHCAEQTLMQTTTNNVYISFQLLHRMHEHIQTITNNNNNNNNNAYTTIKTDIVQWVITCWREHLLSMLQNNKKQEQQELLLSPEEVYDRIEQYIIDTKIVIDDTDNNSNIHMIIALLVNAIGIIEKDITYAPIRAEQLIQKYCNMIIKQQQQQNYSFPLLSTAIINNLLTLWQRSSSTTKLQYEKVNKWVQQLEDSYYNKSNNYILYKPNAYTYSILLSINMKYNPYETSIYATKLYYKKFHNNNNDNNISFVLLSAIIRALTNVGKVEQAKNILQEWILQQKQQQQTSNNNDKTFTNDNNYYNYKDIDNFNNKNLDDKEENNIISCYPVSHILQGYRKKLMKHKQKIILIQEMEHFFQYMYNIANNNNEHLHGLLPNWICYNILIGAYSDMKKPIRAENIMKQYIIQQQQHYNDSTMDEQDISSTTTLWNSVIDAWAKSEDVQAPLRIEHIINNKMKYPNTKTYTILMNCLANDRYTNSVNNSKKIQYLLEQLERGEIMNDRYGTIVKPDEYTYGTVMKAWCQAGYPEKAEILLLEKLCNNKQSTVEPTSWHFTTVMSGWARSLRRRTKGEKYDNSSSQQPLVRIERLLRIMRDLHINHGFNTKPTLVSYSILLDCISNSRHPDAPVQAESILRFLLNSSNDDEELSPNAIIVNTVLTAWLRSNRPDAHVRATELFQEMKNRNNNETLQGQESLINSATYTTMMTIYSKRIVPQLAQSLFNEMEQSTDVSLRPTFITYVRLLHVWACAGEPEIASKVLSDLLHAYESGKFNNNYNNCESKPETQAFNSVLHAWLHSKRKDAADKILLGIETMEKLYTSGRFKTKPNLASYMTAIQAFSFSDDTEHRVERAMNVFQKMKRLYDDTGDPSIRPNLDIYYHLIKLVATTTTVSDSIDERRRCVMLIQNLLDDVCNHVHKSYWKVKGNMMCYELIRCFYYSDVMTTNNYKMQVMNKVREIAKFHNIELDNESKNRLES